MENLEDIQQSKEMAAVVKAVAALRKRFGFSQSDQKHHWPIALALVGRYKADVVLGILTDNKDYYPGYKEVLTASLGGWLIAPWSRELREALIIQAALKHMGEAEKQANLRTSIHENLTIEEDIAARYLFTSSEFLVEVYDCLGGHRAFSEAPSIEELWDAFDNVEKTINTVARSVGFLHQAVDKFGRPGFAFKPSLNKAVAVFEELKTPKRAFPYKDTYVSRSLLHQRWSQSKQTIALIYAASTIRIHRKTLLTIMLDGFLSFSHHGKYLPIWLSRTRYVANHIFARMNDRELEIETFKLVGEGDATSFAPPRLTESEGASFDAVFRSFIRA